MSETGRRCPARTLLEFDHIDEVARGGQASIGRMRLRCRAHNQYAAERTFGAGFMEHKREETRRAAEGRKRAAAEVIPWLRQLGFRADEARRAAGRCESMPSASLEKRVRLALSCFSKPPGREHGPGGNVSAARHAGPRLRVEMELVTGIEPVTPSLRVTCSTS